MILPHPESDLSLNIMVLGADIVKYLKKNKEFVLVETLMEHFLKTDPERTPEMFLNALTFLYAVNLVQQKDYRIKLDIIG